MLFGLAALRGMLDKRHVGCLHTRAYSADVNRDSADVNNPTSEATLTN
jgi:hypothetical protein